MLKHPKQRWLLILSLYCCCWVNKLDVLTFPRYLTHETMSRVTAFSTFVRRKSFEWNPKIEWHSFHARVVCNWVKTMDNLPKLKHTMVERMVNMGRHLNSKSILEFSSHSERKNQM